jgi:hypothetical protein
VPTQPVPNGPQLSTNGLGLNQGLRPGNPVNPGEPPTPAEVHAFRLNEDGSSVYLGPFAAVQIFDTRADLVPTWRVRGPELQTWGTAVAPMRFRTLIPPGYKEAYEPLHRELALADENLLSKQRHLAKMTELDQRAAEQLEYRRGEVQEAVVEVKTGEEERAVELAELDRLRRELQDAHARMERLITETRQLEQALPHPTSQVASE